MVARITIRIDLKKTVFLDAIAVLLPVYITTGFKVIDLGENQLELFELFFWWVCQ